MENAALIKEIKSCFRKRMNYRETREYLLSLGKYDYQTLIPALQKEYVRHKTKFAWSSLIFSVIYTAYHLFTWYMERGFEGALSSDYRHILIGAVVIVVSLVSMQRAKAAARRYEVVV